MVKGLSNFDTSKLLAALAPYFDVEEFSCSTDNFSEDAEKFICAIGEHSEVGGCFGLVTKGQNCFRLLKLKDFDAAGNVMDQSIPATLKRLDVTILREVIMTLGLGMDPGNSEGKIEYSPVIMEAIEKAVRGDVLVSFILNPTRVDQMRGAAEKGYKMPQKSTYFYPKLSSGMVLNVF